MKRLISILVIALISFSTAAFSAGKLKILPEKPVEFGTVQLEYTPDERLTDKENLKLFIYSFSHQGTTPVAYEIPLDFNSLTNVAKASFRLPDDAVFLMIKVDGEGENFIETDDNFGDFWNFLVHTIAGKPIKHAAHKAGISFLGNLPDNCKRNVDFDKAIDYFEQELRSYPDNIQAEIAITSLLYEIKRITKDDFERRLKIAVGKRFNRSDEAEVRAVSRALRVLGNDKQAAQLEYEFASANTRSELSEEALLSELAQAQSLEEFVDISRDFIDFFPRSAKRAQVFSALVTAFLQISEYQGLIWLLNSLDNVPPEVFSQIAIELASRRDLMPDSARSIRLASSFALLDSAFRHLEFEDRMGIPTMNKPKYFTDTEWIRDKGTLRGAIYETAGQVYTLADSQRIALKYYQKALEDLGQQAAPRFYENLISLCRQLNVDSLAYSYAVMAVANSKSNETIEDNFIQLAKKTFMHQVQNYDSLLIQLKYFAQKKRLDALYFKQLNQKASEAALRSIDGRLLDISDFRGKITVINFWSSWCGPCRVNLPAMDSLYSIYRTSPDIAVTAISIWENPDTKDSDVKRFLQNTNFAFQLFTDHGELIPRKFGLTGLPVTLVLDKNGVIRFKIEGFTDTDSYVNSIIDRVNFIKEFK